MRRYPSPAPPALAVLAVLMVASATSGKPKKLEGEVRALAEIESKVKDLQASKSPKADFDALTTWLGVPARCDDCDAFRAANWLSGDLDGDPDEEKVLALTMKGAGACAVTTLDVIVFDRRGTEWMAVGHTRASVGGAKAAEVSLAKVHAQMQDLILRVQGQCAPAAVEQRVSVFTLETGRLEQIAASDDVVGSGLTGYTVVGAPPSAIEWASAKGKAKVTYDPAHGYDTFASYEQAKKAAVSGSDDQTLGPTECGAPMTTELATECRLKGDAKLDVMVQHGKAIGMTVTTSPLDRAFGRCARKVLAAATWKSVPAASGCSRSFSVK